MIEADTSRAGAVEELVKAMLGENGKHTHYLGGLALSHYLGSGTHVVRVAHRSRFATDIEIETIVLAVQRATGGIPEPGRHQKVDPVTGNWVTLLTWPVVQPKLL